MAVGWMIVSSGGDAMTWRERGRADPESCRLPVHEGELELGLGSRFVVDDASAQSLPDIPPDLDDFGFDEE